MTPEEAAGLLTFEVKTTVTEDGQEVEKWIGHDGKLTTEETKLTLNEDFDFDEETGKYTLKLEELEAGEYTVIETDKEQQSKAARPPQSSSKTITRRKRKPERATLNW